MSNSIIILGPMDVGKTTLASSLANTLNKPRCSLDEIQWSYLAETDFDHKKVKALLRTDLEMFRLYADPYMVDVVERAILEHPGHIIDFGGGHTAFDDPNHANRIKTILAPIPLVLLLMPSAVTDVSQQMLPGPAEGKKMNPTFIEHPLQYELSKHVIYTHGKNADAVSREARIWIQEHDN